MASGLELMLFGMGTVLLFLTLLVLATQLMSALVDRYFAEPAAPEPAASATGIEPLTLAIISAAVHHHRQLASQESSHV